MTASDLETPSSDGCTTNNKPPLPSGTAMEHHKATILVPGDGPAAITAEVSSPRETICPKATIAATITTTTTKTLDQRMEEAGTIQSDKNNNERIDERGDDMDDESEKECQVALEKAQLGAGPHQQSDLRRSNVQAANYMHQPYYQKQRPLHHHHHHHHHQQLIQQYQQQQQQHILPINLQPIVGHQQNFIQPTSAAFQPASGVYPHPLVSWTCPVTDGTNQIRDSGQLYGALLHHHYPCASYHPIVQPGNIATGNFTSPGPMPMASYLPGPAFYTGPFYQQQHLPIGPTHQQVVPPAEQRTNFGQPQSISGIEGDAKAACVDQIDELAAHHNESKFVPGETCDHANVAAICPPRTNSDTSNGNDTNDSNNNDDDTNGALDIESILNRSPSQRWQQQRQKITESSQDSPTPSANLIASGDNEINGADNGVNGNDDDDDVDKRASTRSKCQQTRPQGLPGPAILTDNHRQPRVDQRISRDSCQRQDINIDNGLDSGEQLPEDTNGLMMAANKKSTTPSNETKHARLVGGEDCSHNENTSGKSQDDDDQNQRESDEQVVRSSKLKTPTEPKEATAKSRPALNQISINGTTFYHVNPAILRSLPATSGPTHPYLALNYTSTYQPVALATSNGGSPPNLVPYYQQQAHQPPSQAHVLPMPDYYYWPTRQPLPYTVPFGLIHPYASQYYHPQGTATNASDHRPTPAYHSHIPHPLGVASLPQASTYGPTATVTTNTVPPTIVSTGSVPGGEPPLPTSSATTTDVSQLKLGYNLIPLLPINAIPTRVRQAYGMDKVWQDEFEQLFSQFVSQIVWTLVEVETNPNIRSSSRILAYKGRYIVRVDGPPVGSDETDGGASMASAQDGVQSEVEPASGDDDEEEEDDESSWIEADDEQNCCSTIDAEDNNSGDGDGGPPGRMSGSNCESDCDSGAALNSSSGGSDTTSQDLSSPSELGPNQSVTPTSSSPGQMIGTAASSGVPDAAQGVRKVPLKFRMFIDSAKVRFCCDTCGHGWTSMKGRVVFWYELFELVDGPGRKNTEGVSNLIGYCAYKLFGQQCDICKIENRFERPMWYPEEVTKVLCNLFNKIGQVYFGLRMPTIDKQRRAGKPKTSHNSLLCQACHDGVCTDRK